VFQAGHVMTFYARSPAGEMAERITKRIDRELDLTDEQRSQVAKIVAQRVFAFKNTFNDAYFRIKEEFELLHDEVAPILSDEQKLKWEKRYKKMQKVMTRIHKRYLSDQK
jgi:hypothetical protein